MDDRYQLTSEERKTLEALPIPCAVYQFLNRRVVTLLVSDGFCELFGFDREEAIHVMDHDMYRDCFHEDEARIADEAIRFATEGGVYEAVYRNRRPGSSEYSIVHALGRHVYTEDGTRLAVVWYTDEGIYREGDGTPQADRGEAAADDMGAMLKESFHGHIQIESLRADNLYDDLTGLPNRSYFPLLAKAFREELVSRGQLPVMMFFDLTGMKRYNEKYGYAEGDRLLRGVGNVLRGYFSNESLARFGSDHFLAVAEEDDEKLEAMLKQIFDEVAELNDGRSLPIRVGIYRDSFENVTGVMAADRAKAACDLQQSTYISTYTYYDRALYDQQRRKAYVLDNFDRAMEEGWIRAYYQPIVRGVSGLVCDEEALARWIDPEEGVLSPAEFIPVLEEARLLHRLDLHMVDLILEDMEEMAQSGLRVVPVSVNLSWYDFQQCDMVEEISRRVDAAGISHDLLNIEITETVIGKDPAYMKTQIDRFREKGFPVWMDDFGSGYSSLDVLQHFNFDLIKFNMQFMRDFRDSAKCKIILNMLTQMAVKMGVDTLTEGVETAEQLAFLREIGCDKIQGFYYSKPIPPEEMRRQYIEGEGIGMENYLEYEYLDAISKVNLNDPALTEEIDHSLYNYFSSIPMAVLEIRDGEVRVMRHNKTFGDFVERNMQGKRPPESKKGISWLLHPDDTFRQALDKSQASDIWVPVLPVIPGKGGVSGYVKKLKENPVNGAVSVVAIIQSMVGGAGA